MRCKYNLSKQLCHLKANYWSRKSVRQKLSGLSYPPQDEPAAGLTRSKAWQSLFSVAEKRTSNLLQ